MSPPKSRTPAPVGLADANAAVEHVIALVEELSLVIAQENQVLARGIPASLSASVARKHELADAFEQWVKQVAGEKLCAYSDDVLRQRLLARVQALRDAMAENVTRLRAAIDASRRRIEAVMRAIRTEVSAASPYGPNGRLRDSRNAHSVSGNGISA
jgi:hypothetical protein